MPLFMPYWQLNYFKWDGQDAGITTWMRMLQQRPPRRQYRCADLFVRVHVLRIVRDGSPAGYLPKLWWRAGSKTQEVAGQVGRQSGFNKACTQARWLPQERLTWQEAGITFAWSSTCFGHIASAQALEITVADSNSIGINIC